MRDPRERLRDILGAVAAIERHARCDRETFEKDEMLQGWCVRHLRIIGEAASALPEEVRELAPDIPWNKITGMRNVLVHGYFEIDTGIVWDAATRDAPALKAPVVRLLAKLEQQGR